MFEPPRRRKSWFGRNWFWVVPVGCLGLCSLPFLLIGGLAAALFGSMRTSGAYSEAIDIVKHHPAAIEALGEPIKAGWFWTGKYNLTGTSSGDIDIAVGVSGPDAEGTLYIVAHKSGGAWRYDRLELEVHGRPGRIDLLEGTTGLPPPEGPDAGDLPPMEGPPA